MTNLLQKRGNCAENTMQVEDHRFPNLIDHAEKIRNIGELQLGEHRYGLPENHPDRVVGLLPDNTRNGYIVGGGVATFTENVSGQVKQDILNATLLAQLAANKKHYHERSTDDWYREYNRVLGILGFVIESFEFDSYSTSCSILIMADAVLQIIGAKATSDEVAVLKETLVAMSKLSNDDKKIVLFGTHVSQSYSGNFQVYTCSQAPNGDVSLILGTFSFEGTQKDTNLLFYHWPSWSTQLYKEVQKAVLNTKVYAAVRSAIVAKLGDNAVSLVASIEIWGSSIVLPLAGMCEY